MPILTILIVIIAAGVFLWAVNSWIPMDSKIKNIFNVVVIVVLVFWLLNVFGILHVLQTTNINSHVINK
jgi:hypothetical protein